MLSRLSVAIFSLLLAACVNMPNTYAPPMQRRALAGPDTSNLKHFIAMNEAHAADHFLRDVHPELQDGSWRWTGQKPTFRFVLPSIKHLRLVMDFSIPDPTFRQTGPVTISWAVNGRLLDKVSYDAPGEKHFEKPLDPSWLYKGDNVVSVELDKVYVSPDDGARLGIALNRIGFLD